LIDALSVRIPEQIAFTREFDPLFDGLALHSSRHYDVVADLRPYSVSAILHYRCKHGQKQNHKLELVNVGKMTLPDMKKEIQQVFQVDAGELSIMRLDLAVDVEGIGVPWFVEHTRVRYKRWLATLGVIDAAEMGNRQIQTAYWGKRPNVIRVYDKYEELRAQYRRILRAVPEGMVPPTFEQCFELPEFGHILTRVERQMGGGRVPGELATVGDLQDCANFNPFSCLEFISGGKALPDPKHYTFMEHAAGMHLRHLAETQGMQAAIAYITRNSKRNKKWALGKFGDFLPVPSQDDLTGERLFELFQRSVVPQLKPQGTA